MTFSVNIKWYLHHIHMAMVFHWGQTNLVPFPTLIIQKIFVLIFFVYRSPPIYLQFEFMHETKFQQMLYIHHQRLETNKHILTNYYSFLPTFCIIKENLTRNKLWSLYIRFLRLPIHHLWQCTLNRLSIYHDMNGEIVRSLGLHPLMKSKIWIYIYIYGLFQRAQWTHILSRFH